jgi:hypothetical protein
MAEVSQAELVAIQIAALRAMAENMRLSFASYLDAIEQSAELRDRLATSPVAELRGAFELIHRRALALVDSAQLAATSDGPETDKGQPS